MRSTARKNARFYYPLYVVDFVVDSTGKLGTDRVRAEDAKTAEMMVRIRQPKSISILHIDKRT